MDEQNQNRSTIPTISGLVLALAALGFFTLKELPLQVTRPDRPEVPHGYLAVKENVRARLWEDPFDAVSKYEKAQGLEAGDTLHGFNRLLCQIDSRPDLFVLFVMANGGPYAEDAEWRLRYRYALVSALLRLNYVPKDSTHIGYVYFSLEEPLDTCDPVLKQSNDPETQSTPVILPYEWFQPLQGEESSEHPTDANHPSSILILWLDDTAFQTNPLQKLGALVRRIRNPLSGENPDFLRIAALESLSVAATIKEAKATNGKKQVFNYDTLCIGAWTTPDSLVGKTRSSRPEHRMYFRVLGPVGSTGMVAMLKELKKAKEEKTTFESLKGVEIYSPNATASDALLLREFCETAEERPTVHALCEQFEVKFASDAAADDTAKSAGTNGREPTVHDLFDRSGPEFYRTILSDEKLAEALVTELEERDISLGQGESHIALVGEWDTFYARALAGEFETKLADRLEELKSKRKPGIKAQDIIHNFSYLRGIDGKVPTKSDAESGKKEDAVSREEERAFRRPVGPGQFDYLRRMAENIAQCNERLACGNKGSIKAIGILGNDLYDKLLLLQALKPRFPTAIFFTTDMDARFLHPSDSKWTRNLVVASNLGLTLCENLQGSIPPFRDNYQASLFLTTLIALHRITDEKGHALTQTSINRLLDKPRVFEIGLRTAFNLSPPGVQDATGPDTPESAHFQIDTNRFENVHPQRIAGTWGKTIKAGLALCLALALAYVCVYGLLKIREHQKTCSFSQGSFLIAFEFLALAGLFYGVTQISADCLTGALMFPLALALVYFSVQSLRNLTRDALSLISNHPISSTTMVFLFVSFLYLFSKKLSLALEKEPFAFLEGVSVWPTELIRTAAFVTAVCFVFRAWFLLKRGNIEVADEFDLESHGTKQLSRRIDDNLDRPSLINQFRRCIVETSPSVRKRTREIALSVRHWRTELSIDHWGKDRKDEEIPVERLWKEYLHRSLLWKRMVRTLPMVFLYFVFSHILMTSFGRPVTPARGDATFDLCLIVIFSTVFSLMFLIFFVVDATRLCHRFIDQIVHNRRIWITCKPTHNEASLGQWRIIQLIAGMTDPVGRLILYPFVVFFLLIVSRLSLFDNWHFPKTLIVVISIGLLYAVGCAFRIRRAAERARGKVVEELRQQLVRLSPEDSAKGLGVRIRTIIQEVTSNRTGAFQHLSHQPLVKALLLPFGGFGGVALLEYLASGRF